MIFNTTIETMPRKYLKQVQIEKLQSTLNRVYRHVSFYKNAFDSHGVNIEGIKSIEDLGKLPFTTKDDLRKSYPYDMFAMPLRDIVRLHCTSGTTGTPVVVGYTKNDLQAWSECTARTLSACGVTEHDFVQIAFHYDLFTGGFGFHQGAERIGASVIPASMTAIEKQITIMRDYKTTVIIGSPGFIMNLISVMKELGIHPEKLFLKTGIFGSEPWSNQMRTYIEENLKINALDTYGLTEIMGPGVAFECEHKNGLHINEDHFICELINPDTCEPVETGGRGELVFTTISKEGFPLIRYRTGDIVALMDESTCACGRTLRRMTRVTGRTDDLIFFEQFKFFPGEVEKILYGVIKAASHYQIIIDREGGNDVMEIKVEVPQGFAIDELKNLEQLQAEIAKKIETSLGFKPKIALVEPKSLIFNARGKTNRVVDRRKMK
ncbi:MAG: phenylacetate--CoA ligase [Spirochaetales bacterium]|nr:phenylacetate--CoA ligase [Spirochaetales bacterium]